MCVSINLQISHLLLLLLLQQGVLHVKMLTNLSISSVKFSYGSFWISNSATIRWNSTRLAAQICSTICFLLRCLRWAMAFCFSIFFRPVVVVFAARCFAAALCFTLLYNGAKTTHASLHFPPLRTNSLQYKMDRAELPNAARKNPYGKVRCCCCSARFQWPTKLANFRYCAIAHVNVLFNLRWYVAVCLRWSSRFCSSFLSASSAVVLRTPPPGVSGVCRLSRCNTGWACCFGGSYKSVRTRRIDKKNSLHG